MIDLHAHILPNIDDGAKSIEETYHLMEEARKVGFEAIVTTSHYIEGYDEVPNSERKKIIDTISQKVNSPILYLGNEMYLSENIISLLKEQKGSTINGTNYLLFEMPLNAKTIGLEEVIYTLLQNKIIPILAHPERYISIQKNPQMVYELVEKGVLMQANYGSIIRQYGTKAQIIVSKLLQSNLIHFLGSDVHRQNSIYPKIPQILEKLKLLIGEQKLEELTTRNPKKVIENEKIVIDDPKEMSFSLKERFLLNRKNRS